MKSKLYSFAAGLLLTASFTFAKDSSPFVDSIAFGDAASEKSHNFIGNQSEVIKGGLDESARRLSPLTPETWEGGRVSFTLKVDPDKPNYATIRLWGSDATVNELILFCEGRQIGYRHLGDIDILDIGNGGPRYPVEMHSAHAGEKLPIAKIPEGARFRPGDESVYAGKGSYYTLRHGDYLIGQNMTPDKTFELKPPAGAKEARELVSGKTLKLDAPIKVAPRSTVVLWLGK